MLTDEQLTKIWRRLQSIELNDLGEMVDGEFYLRIWPNGDLHRSGSVAQGEFIENSKRDIEALLIEVKRLRGILGSVPTDEQVRVFMKDIIRESVELPPVIEDQLDSGVDE